MSVILEDIEAIELALDEEILCDVDHDELREDGFDIPCAIVAVARITYCDGLLLMVCSQLLEEVQRSQLLGGVDGKCGYACARIIRL